MQPKQQKLLEDLNGLDSGKEGRMNFMVFQEYLIVIISLPPISGTALPTT